MKSLLTSEPVTAFPNFSLPFRLYTDASDEGLGAILAQVQDGKEKLICCASRSLSKSEKNYSVTKKECLAVVWGVRNFRHYLLNTNFNIFTDHYSLTWLKQMKSQSALLFRWASELEEYDYTITYRPGKLQTHVDALSRLPIRSVSFTEGGSIKLTQAEAFQLLTRLHNDSHLGKKKLMTLFRKRYACPKLGSLTEKVVKSCGSCQRAKDYGAVKGSTGKISATAPWELLSLDIAGPFPTFNGYRYILTIIDFFQL